MDIFISQKKNLKFWLNASPYLMKLLSVKFNMIRNQKIMLDVDQVGDILIKLEQLEGKALDHDGDIQLIFEHLKKLLNPKVQPIRQIGFRH